MEIKRILFPTDFSSCADAAFSTAVLLAEINDAQLHLLHVSVLFQDDPNTEHIIPNVEEVHQKIRAGADEKMNKLLAGHDTTALEIIKAHERGLAPARVILDYAEEHAIDLIVMGTHGRRGPEYLFLGSVAQETVRHASCPVLTIREGKDSRPFRPIDRILVPIDFSSHSEAALQQAVALAKKLSARLQLLHVIEESVHPAFYASGKTSIFDFIPDLKQKTEAELQRMLSTVAAGDVQAEYHVLEGRASHDIAKFAREQGSDLIVISTHGLTGIEHFLVGSVTEKVIRTAHCPVLTVKAPKMHA